MRISDWSSDVCSSDLPPPRATAAGRRSRTQAGRTFASFARRPHRQGVERAPQIERGLGRLRKTASMGDVVVGDPPPRVEPADQRSEERRVGKAGGRTCKSRGAPNNKKKKKSNN